MFLIGKQENDHVCVIYEGHWEQTRELNFLLFLIFSTLLDFRVCANDAEKTTAKRLTTQNK